MQPDDILTYSSMALPPALATFVGALALHAVHRDSMSVRTCCVLFAATVAVGIVLSFELMDAFSNLLHGDGALGVVFVPMMGAALTVPVALIFGVVGLAIRSGRRARKDDV